MRVIVCSCHEPIEMRGKSLIHLEDIHRHMRCVDKYGDRPERDAAILIGTLIGNTAFDLTYLLASSYEFQKMPSVSLVYWLFLACGIK